MFSVGLSSCSKELNEQLFADYKAAGIEKMELSLDSEALAELDFKQTKALADQYGITLHSFHIPFSPFYFLDPSDPEKQEVTLSYFRWCIKKGADMGIKVFVVHPSAEPIEESDRPRRMETAKQSLAALADYAKQYDAVIAVENLPRTCLGRDSRDLLDLLSAHPALRCCYDTNHLLSENAIDFIHAVGDKIITTHVSDYDFLNERHWLPGEGKVEWQSILSALKEVGYTGPWLYELGFATPASIVRARKLTAFDFADNAKALFDCKEPTVLGTPIDGLRAWR